MLAGTISPSCACWRGRSRHRRRTSMLARLLTRLTSHIGMTTDRHCQNSGSKNMPRKRASKTGSAKRSAVPPVPRSGLVVSSTAALLGVNQVKPRWPESIAIAQPTATASTPPGTLKGSFTCARSWVSDGGSMGVAASPAHARGYQTGEAWAWQLHLRTLVGIRRGEHGRSRPPHFFSRARCPSCVGREGQPWYKGGSAARLFTLHLHTWPP